MEQLPLLYRDDHLVVINKPSGLLVHRSEIDRHETRFVLQIVRDQLGQYVYPVHRLDKPTSGALILALNPDAARLLSNAFINGDVRKIYHAITRGFCPEQGLIDHALKEELDKYSDRKAQKDKPPQPALTHFRALAKAELPVAIETYPTSRYSLVECRPLTGRKHQIRRHLKHINHPIIGDAKHGRGRHNRYFKEHLNAGRLLLHASAIEFPHPFNGAPVSVSAAFDDCFNNLFHYFNWQPPALLAKSDTQ